MDLSMASSASSGAATGILGLMAGFYGVMMVIYCVIILVALAGFVFWVWMLIDALSRKNYDHENDRLLWCLVVFLGSWLGALLYFFLIRQKKGSGMASSPPDTKTVKK